MELETKKSDAFWKGYEAKKNEVYSIGWNAARDSFNLANPPGQKWTGSVEGLEYAHGEYAALSDSMGLK